MTGQDAAAVVALLDLPDCLSSHASRRQAALYSEIQPPDAAEEAAYGQGLHDAALRAMVLMFMCVSWVQS